MTLEILNYLNVLVRHKINIDQEQNKHFNINLITAFLEESVFDNKTYLQLSIKE